MFLHLYLLGEKCILLYNLSFDSLFYGPTVRRLSRWTKSAVQCQDTHTHKLELLLCVHFNSLEGAKGERESGQLSAESGECERERNRIVALALLTRRKKE